MKTLRIYPENPNPRDIALATETLRNGGIIIYRHHICDRVRRAQRKGSRTNLPDQRHRPQKGEPVDSLLRSE